MIYPKTCYNTMVRVLDTAEIEETGLVRIGRLAEHFKDGGKVVKTCGVVTGMSGAYNPQTEEMFVEMQLDDGVDQVTVFIPYICADAVNLGKVVECVIKKSVPPTKMDTMDLFLGGQALEIGTVIEADMLVC